MKKSSIFYIYASDKKGKIPVKRNNDEQIKRVKGLEHKKTARSYKLERTVLKKYTRAS
ncbi:MAG: hypothetical protein ACTTKC_06710 [Treponema sp.]|uniref:hypothetical protein n=1 Tax=Treponema sp. TaxID=166 RepID=UPI003FA1FEEA